MKFINNVLTFLLLLTILNSVYATQSRCNGMQSRPCIVQDTVDNSPVVRQWRDSQMMMQAYKDVGDVTGLANLWMSGSAMPGAAGWGTIHNNIMQASQHKIKQIIDVDLRQESHGYLNDNAITLAVKYDWINRGKTHAQALNSEQHWLQYLSKQSRISLLTDEQFDEGDFSDGEMVTVKSIRNEAEVVRRAGFGYMRLTVTDHMAPDDDEVDRFVHFTKTLLPQTWVHFHCRGGKGRTATFMVMFDMLHNADKVSFDNIAKRQAAVAPYYDVTKVARGKPELTPYYQQRLEFLKDFYQFSYDSLHGYAGTWTEWKSKS